MMNSNNPNYMNYPPYLYYNQPYPNYPQTQDPSLMDSNNHEELEHITQFIKNLRDPEKRE